MYKKTPSNKTNSHQPLITTIIVLLLAAVLLVTGGIIWKTLDARSNSDGSAREVEVQEQTHSMELDTDTVIDADATHNAATSQSVENQVGVYQIAYEQDGQTWVVDSTGANKKRLLGRTDVLEWKSADELSYAICDAEGCRVAVIDPETNASERVWDAPPSVQSILAMSWYGDDLVVMTRGALIQGNMIDDMAVYLINTAADTSRELIALLPMSVRPVARTDRIDLQFNADGSAVMVLNTFISKNGVWSTEGRLLYQPPQREYQMIGFDKQGSFYVKHYMPTTRTWELLTYDANTFELKSTESFFSGDHERVAPDGSKICYDREIDGEYDQLYVHTMGGEDQPLAQDFAFCKWVGTEQLLAVNTGGNQQKFAWQSLDVLDALTGKIQAEVANGEKLTDFAVAPQPK